MLSDVTNTGYKRPRPDVNKTKHADWQIHRFDRKSFILGMSQTSIFLFRTDVCQKIILKISFPLRIHANCRQEVHSYIIKDELYSKFASFCQINNIGTIAVNSFGKLLAVASHFLALERNSLTANNFVRIQTFSFKFMAHSRVLSLNIVLKAFDVTNVIFPPIL